MREHLAPGARFIFDVFNPNVRVLAGADRVRRARESLWFTDPDRGDVRVDVAETYDAGAEVTRGTWHLSTDPEPDFVVLPLEVRSIFPQDLPLLLRSADFGSFDRFGDWSRRSFTGDAPALRLRIRLIQAERHGSDWKVNVRSCGCPCTHLPLCDRFNPRIEYVSGHGRGAHCSRHPQDSGPGRDDGSVWWAVVLGLAAAMVGLVDGIVMASKRHVAQPCPNGTSFPEGTTNLNRYVHPNAGLGIVVWLAATSAAAILHGSVTGLETGPLQQEPRS